jgi:hypothetical protein
MAALIAFSIIACVDALSIALSFSLIAPFRTRLVKNTDLVICICVILRSWMDIPHESAIHRDFGHHPRSGPLCMPDTGAMVVEDGTAAGPRLEGSSPPG